MAISLGAVSPSLVLVDYGRMPDYGFEADGWLPEGIVEIGSGSIRESVPPDFLVVPDSVVRFPEQLRQVPEWASAHHEFLNGKGYPLHASGDSIPAEVRLLTILDIFEALTAKDRPYKKSLPVDRSLAILHSMVEEGCLDGDWLSLFEQSRAWEG